MKSVVNFLLRRRLKRDSSASNSEKKTKFLKWRPMWMVCQGVKEGVPSSITPDKMQGSCFEGLIPISIRIFVMRLYQC